MSHQGFDFQKWYAENGAELNKSRRDRYKKDPEYRKRVLDANRASREKRRKERRKKKRAEKEAIKVKAEDKKPYKVVEATVAGTTARLFTIGALAGSLGCSVQAVRLWEKKGKLPETPLRNSKGDRLYTAEQVEMVHELFKAQGKIEPGKLLKKPEVRSFRRKVKLKGRKRPVEMNLFRVGVMADSINRTVVTVDQMEELGRIPKTPFRASKTQYRLYSFGMISVVQKAMAARLGIVRGEKEWKKFHDEVLRGWKKLGVVGAKLVD